MAEFEIDLVDLRAVGQEGGKISVDMTKEKRVQRLDAVIKRILLGGIGQDMFIVGNTMHPKDPAEIGRSSS